MGLILPFSIFSMHSKQLPSGYLDRPGIAAVMTNPNVLLVEDEQLLRMSLELNLRRHGIQTATAAGGKEALSFLQQHSCELLITDYLMAEMTGAELLQETRQQFPAIKVIVISGYADETLKEEILKAGADRFLWKPVNLETLVTAIEEVLQVSRTSCRIS